MLVSTTTGAWNHRNDGQYIPMGQSIRKIAAAGFDAVDLNFCRTIRQPALSDGIELNSPVWERWVEEIRQVLEDCKIVANQSHAPYYNVLNDTISERETWEEMVRRSIIASGRLGIKWVAIHPGYLVDCDSAKQSLTKNIEYFAPHLELAAKHGTGLAIENMFDASSDLKNRAHRHFGSGLDELLELVERLGEKHSNVGVCWDFGHGNEMALNQEHCFRLIGKRLAALHVNDNNGVLDDHLLPFSGNINWPSLMGVLGEIGYEGDFTYEAHRFTQRLPDELIDEALRFSVSVARYLTSLI